MSVLSKLSSPTVLGAGLFLTWAAWYDHYRRSRPDYLDKLVERRKSELLEERKRNDPLYHVKNLPLASNPNDPMTVQSFAMELMTEGEGAIEKGDKSLGASKIALGLAYFPAQQIQMIMMQLAQSLPQDIVMMIRERLNTARGRVQTQRIESMMGAKKMTDASSGISRLQDNATPVITEKPKDEEGPDDVDSIDGDSEERVVEVGEVKEEATKEEVKVEELPEDEQSQEEKIVELADDTKPEKPSEVEEKISEAINEASPESELQPSANPTQEEDSRETAELLAQEQELVEEVVETVVEEEQSQSEPEVLQAESQSTSDEPVKFEPETGAGEGQVQEKVEEPVVEAQAKGESLDLQEEEDLD